MRKIAVLMCTYNGERYLREQINSIIAQKDVSVSILVRDDGSKDGTTRILDEYQNKADLTWYQENNVGPAVGFMELLYRVDRAGVDYFAFADQDDIWFENKLARAVEKIEQYEGSDYVLYGSNQTLLKNDKKIGNVYDTMPLLNTAYLLNHNKIAGCTIVINRSLADFIIESSHVDNTILKSRMHDLWLTMTACVCGDIVFDMQSNMLYRIHGRNVVGKENNSFGRKIQRLKRDRGERSNSRSNYAAELLRCYGTSIKPNDRELLDLYANYRKSLRKKIAFLRANDVIRSTGENSLVFRFKILMNYI